MPITISRHGRYIFPWRRGTDLSLQNRAIYTKPRNSRQSSSTTQPSSDRGRVIFSGIQPTGVPHLGNYLGALREWVRLQNDSGPTTSLFFSIADLHALTVPQDAAQLFNWRRETFATLLAVGLDPKRSTIFYQSSVYDHVVVMSHWRGWCADYCQVAAHAELMWVLSTVASMGYLSRMTQWKVSASIEDTP